MFGASSCCCWEVTLTVILTHQADRLLTTCHISLLLQLSSCCTMYHPSPCSLVVCWVPTAQAKTLLLLSSTLGCGWEATQASMKTHTGQPPMLLACTSASLTRP